MSSSRNVRVVELVHSTLGLLNLVKPYEAKDSQYAAHPAFVNTPATSRQSSLSSDLSSSAILRSIGF